MTWSPFLSAEVEVPAIDCGEDVLVEARRMHRRHVAAIVVLAAALATGRWGGVVPHALGRYLEAGERRALLEALLDGAPPEEAAELAEHAHERVAAGMPLPPLSGFRGEARWWSAWASLAERKHYLVAIFRSLPQVERVRALPALQRFALK